MLTPTEEAQRFLDIVGCQRRVPERAAEFIAGAGHAGIDDPYDPSLLSILDGLRHVWPPDWAATDVAYLHHLAMVKYAAADMLASASMADVAAAFRRDPSDVFNRGYASSIWPIDLQETMWFSLLEWKPRYAAEAQAAIGRYLVSVHLAHTLRFRRIFRPEFLLAAVWQKTVHWLGACGSEYMKADARRYEALRKAVTIADRRGVSAIRVLCGECPEELWVKHLEWHELGLVTTDSVPGGTDLVIGRESGRRTGMLTVEEEEMLNRSLRAELA